MKIYLACALTHVPRNEFAAYVAFLHATAFSLERTCGAEVKYALRDSDPQLADRPFNDRAKLCYLWDKAMVEWSDVVVADATYPSTGLGIELQIASSNSIPIVLLFQAGDAHKAAPVTYENPDRSSHNLQVGDGYVSLMALGLPSVAKIVPYGDSGTAPQSIGIAVRSLMGIE